MNNWKCPNSDAGDADQLEDLVWCENGNIATEKSNNLKCCKEQLQRKNERSSASAFSGALADS